jgi:Ca2+-binding EF-hand superfamily protein
MLLLDENNNGSIPKKDFEEAMQSLKDNGTAPGLDVETLVDNVYGEKEKL